MALRSHVAFFRWALPVVVLASEPNPPQWPDSVAVFGPETPAEEIVTATSNAYATNGGDMENGQFSSHRYAFLFMPGTYDVDVPVGYYTQVVGLGYTPTDVVFNSSKGVYCEEANFQMEIGALDTFWRSAENFQTNADYGWNGNTSGMLWAASQASPLRSVVVTRNLSLAEYVRNSGEGYSSGGFVANMVVGDTLHFGSQQQFITRSSTFNKVQDGSWNMVFVGTQGVPYSNCGAGSGKRPYTVVDKVPVVAEKPYITVQNGSWGITVPKLKFNSSGAVLTHIADTVPFEDVYVARADVDTSSSINAKLDDNLHVVFAPGIFYLDEPIHVRNPGTVLLGLGLATLVSSNGSVVIRVHDVPGVRVAGILLQAGPASTTLLEWGETRWGGDASNPGMLHDVFARVGGPRFPFEQQVQIMLRINNGNVIGDNIWLWRADHYDGGETVDEEWPCDNALVVDGDDVTLYGLAAEHTLQDIVQWNGERGSTYFFQAEFPYDVTQAYGDNGYVGYRVGSHVLEHEAFGVGVYHFFRDHPVAVQSGISVPPHLESSVGSPLSVYLNGQGTVEHVINDKGNSTQAGASWGAVISWYCPTHGVGSDVVV